MRKVSLFSRAMTAAIFTAILHAGPVFGAGAAGTGGKEAARAEQVQVARVVSPRQRRINACNRTADSEYDNCLRICITAFPHPEGPTLITNEAIVCQNACKAGFREDRRACSQIR